MPGAPTPLYGLTVPSVAGDNNTWGGELNTDLGTLDTVIGSPRIAVTSPTVAGVTTLDLLATPACAFAFTLSQATTLAITNVPATLPTGGLCLVRVFLQITNGGAFSLTWPASVTWNGGAPVLQASGVDTLELWTINGGTNWYGTRLTTAIASGAERATVETGTLYVFGGNPANTFTSIPCDTDIVDVGNIHSTSVNNSRITVNSSWTSAIVNANILCSNMFSGQAVDARILKNGATAVGWASAKENGSGGCGLSLSFIDLQPATNNYYEVQISGSLQDFVSRAFLYFTVQRSV